MSEDVRAPRCPGCDELPMVKMSGQYWCGDPDCQVVVWNPADDPAKFKATAVRVDLVYPTEEGQQQ